MSRFSRRLDGTPGVIGQIMSTAAKVFGARALLGHRYLIVASVVVAGVFLHSAQAQNAQPFEDRFLLGVGRHQGLGGIVSERGYVPDINIKEIKELCLTAFRDDFPWSDFELPGRQFAFPPLSRRVETQIKAVVATTILILRYT